MIFAGGCQVKVSATIYELMKIIRYIEFGGSIKDLGLKFLHFLDYELLNYYLLKKAEKQSQEAKNYG